MNQPEPLQVTIARGNIYVPREVCETYFPGLDAVALLPHAEGVLLIPLIQQTAGGMLLKVRNLRGDRVVHAQEFWRQNGYAEDFTEHIYPVRWNRERAALLLKGVQPV